MQAVLYVCLTGYYHGIWKIVLISNNGGVAWDCKTVNCLVACFFTHIIWVDGGGYITPFPLCVFVNTDVKQCCDSIGIMKKQTLLRIGVVATTLLTALWVHIEWLYVRNRIFTRDSSSLELGLPTGGEFTTNKFLYEELRHRRYRPWMLTRFSFDTLWKEVERRHKDIKLILIKDGLVKSRSFGQEIMAPIKYRKELELLRTVVKVHKLPDVLFLLNIRTFGIDNGNKRSQVPIFSLARDVNSTDLLFPNPYFMEWSERIPQLLNASTVRFPWKDRIAQAFWRGQCQCPQYSQPRVSLVSMADSPLLDVAFAPPHLNCRKQLWPEAEQDTISTLRATEKLFYTKMAAYK